MDSPDEQPHRSPTDKPTVSGWQRDVVIGIDKAVLGFSRNWMVILSLALMIYVGLPFAAPVAMHYGATGVANVIYTVYGPLCHQFVFRSWFLFGDQVVYPRERAGLPGGTFEEYAGNDPYFDTVDVGTLDADLILAAKAFRGNEIMGWKVAYCQRDIAIYGSIALFGILYGLLKLIGIRVPYLPFWAYLLIALGPIGLDGFSQYFANPPFNGFGLGFYPIRESTPFLRVLTGAFFGIGNAWLVYPYLDDSMQETKELLETKLARAGVIKSVEAQAGD